MVEEVHRHRASVEKNHYLLLKVRMRHKDLPLFKYSLGKGATEPPGLSNIEF